MKALQHDLRYDGATVEQVHAMLATPAFREAVSAAQHYHRYEVTIDGAGANMTVRIDQQRPTEGAPAFTSKFVGSEIRIVQQERWSSPTSADLELTIPGKPGEMKGTIRLAERDGGVTESVHVDIKVPIPIVGKKIEDLIAGLLQEALVAENRVGRKWLAG